VEVRPNSIEDALGRPIFWTIPYDRLLRRTAQLGQSLVEAHPYSPAARNITDLARTLAGLPLASNGSLFGRVFTSRQGRGAKEPAGEVKEEAKS